MFVQLRADNGTLSGSRRARTHDGFSAGLLLYPVILLVASSFAIEPLARQGLDYGLFVFVILSISFLDECTELLRINTNNHSIWNPISIRSAHVLGMALCSCPLSCNLI